MSQLVYRNRILDIGGHPLPVYSTPGDGPPVLLLHGWTATARLNWGRSLETLGERWNLISYDHRGHGTGLPRGPQPVSISRYAEDSLQILDALGYDRVVIAGYSMGGAVAQEIWRQAPERVQGLVLAATATHFVEDGVGRQAAKTTLLTGAFISRNLNVAQKTLIRDRLVAKTEKTDGYPGQSIIELGGHDLTALAEAGRSIMEFDSRPWIGSCQCPTAAVATTLDTVVPFRRQIGIIHYLHRATIHPVPGGHSACLERPYEFNAAFEDALRNVAPGGAEQEV